MGFPDSFRIPVSETRAYKQFGNSVVMPVFREVARIMKPYILSDELSLVQPDLLVRITANELELTMS